MHQITPCFCFHRDTAWMHGVLDRRSGQGREVFSPRQEYEQLLGQRDQSHTRSLSLAQRALVGASQEPILPPPVLRAYSVEGDTLKRTRYTMPMHGVPARSPISSTYLANIGRLRSWLSQSRSQLQVDAAPTLQSCPCEGLQACAGHVLKPDGMGKALESGDSGVQVYGIQQKYQQIHRIACLRACMFVG